jgi:hypothetical protein
MSDPRQQKRLLAVVLAILAVSVAWRVVQRPGDAADRGTGDRAGAIDRRLAAGELPSLDLEALRGMPATYSPGRDPFRFGERPAPPPRPAPVAPVRRQPKRNEPANQPVLVSTTPPRPVPPKIDFVYLGSFGPSHRRVAVFSKNDEIYNALAGNVLMDRFIVDKIGFESADIKFVGFPDTPGTRLVAGG